jgi:hypothetical protein
MCSGPSKAAEAVVAIFVPPACREEVLGDLHERYASPRQYGLDALRTIPLVIAGRIRRTADPQVLLIQAFALYLSFLGAAWFKDGAFLHADWGLLRLAIPAAMVMLGVILEDTYADSRRRSPPRSIRGPALGLGLACVSQGVFWAGNSDLAVPRWVLFYGCAMSLLLSSAVRLLLAPATDQPQGANAPALWLKQAGGSAGNPQKFRVVKGVAAIVAVAAVVLFVLIAYQLWKRG